MLDFGMEVVPLLIAVRTRLGQGFVATDNAIDARFCAHRERRATNWCDTPDSEFDHEDASK